MHSRATTFRQYTAEGTKFTQGFQNLHNNQILKQKMLSKLLYELLFSELWASRRLALAEKL